MNSSPSPSMADRDDSEGGEGWEERENGGCGVRTRCNEEQNRGEHPRVLDLGARSFCSGVPVSLEGACLLCL